MKQSLTYIVLSFLGLYFAKPDFVKSNQQVSKNNFKLQFMTVGFGSNMYDMEPVFRVNGTKFLYTSEEVWIFPGQKKIERDTLLTGDFRISSIDSISSLINDLRVTTINKANIHVMSGSACYMSISNNDKKINFDLHNTSDSTADKIVEILNTYIPNGLQKLYISDFKK